MSYFVLFLQNHNFKKIVSSKNLQHLHIHETKTLKNLLCVYRSPQFAVSASLIISHREHCEF